MRKIEITDEAARIRLEERIAAFMLLQRSPVIIPWLPRSDVRVLRCCRARISVGAIITL